MGILVKKMFEFKIKIKSNKSKARIGKFITPHGEIETPVFMPVGTVGAVKTMTPDDLKNVGSQIILGNTYHLYLRPGDKQIKKIGGLHSFNKWSKPILTDSGGFQVFSLGENSKRIFKENKIKPATISDKGVVFHSHINGSKHFIGPEESIKIQENLGADIIMSFDECPPADSSYEKVEQAVLRTNEWLSRCIKAKKRTDQALFPICQGGTYKDLREASARHIASLDLPGNAIGGVSVGEKKDKIYEVTDWCTNVLPATKPRYLMGIGYPEDIARVISLGIDMFDCVLPTRLARHGVVWVKTAINQKSKTGTKKLHGLNYGYRQIDLTKKKNSANTPIDKTCDCYSCKTGFSRDYIAHLIKENEPLGIHLTTIHNLRFTHNLVTDIKNLIKAKKF